MSAAPKNVAPRLPGGSSPLASSQPGAGGQPPNRDALGRALLRGAGWPIPAEAPKVEPAAVVEPADAAPIIFTDAERAAAAEGQAIEDALNGRLELLRLRVEAANGSVGAKAALRLRKALGTDS